MNPSALPRPRTADAAIWLAGLLALGLGTTVYLIDRGGTADVLWFGSAGGWLPSLLHTLAFALFSAALLPAGRWREGAACGGWIAIGLLFEAGQHPALAARLHDVVGGPLGAYFARGRFDPADAAATLAGGLLAAAGLRRLRTRRRRGVGLRWQPLVLLAGIGSLVGSGGGLVGFPDCAEPYCGDPPPPQVSAEIQPGRLIVAAGAPARFTVEVTGLSGGLSYQWRRSDDGGLSFSDIPGATSDVLELPSVALADDGLRVAVSVSQSDGMTVGANLRLLVNASPGLPHEDGGFDDADWTAEPFVPPGGTPAVVDAARVADGGSPGAWRRSVVTVPPGQGSVAVDHLSARAMHDPAVDGAIRVLDFEAQCAASPSGELALLVEQGGRRYMSLLPATCAAGAWGEPVRQLALAPADLALLGSEPCPAGQSCPDFSASGAPLRLGYRQLLAAPPGAIGELGIDNWRVTVWRR